MDQVERNRLEAAIREAQARGDIARAAEIAVDGYGEEIFGYLVGVLWSRDDAAEVFSRFCEDLLRGLGGFRGDSSFRTWAYVLARHALCRFQQGAAKGQRHVPLSDIDGHAALVHKLRSRTAEWAKSSNRDAIRELRRSLPEQDQTILILRVDRGLSWEDVARVTGGFDDSGGAQDRDALRREVNRVKKQYERAAEKLRSMAVQQGLIREGE